ncbi:Helicase associated domain protein [Streptomyces sp. A15ISP2-DRY2]|uniref:Helicase associated domain protein n=2 Tax=Streptomyces ortus TaxID=2867268 RepID=A0ABT3UYF1_9ACTN|nr:DEAD/DEAH box helicase [Streptomyces ortus]MCX4231709.1 Helicase associated domain protein [Streptomyces ortus]
MAQMELRPHQVEAVDNVVRILGVPPGGRMPPEGLRTQVIAATGSGKTLIGAESAHRLSARRVLVLVPTLDLLTQMAGAWRRAGRSGAMVGVCSLRAEESQGLPCTTDPDELVAWLSGLETVTVFATYASVGLGVLQRAHAAGLGVWSLMVVDEAHRTSGDGLKPWATVHDQAQLPAERRLYMTATARVWEAEGERPRLVASMEDGSPVFGPVAYKLTLSEAIGRGIVAPYQVLCLDIRDPDLYAALATEATGSDAVRGARLAAVQSGLMHAAVKERFRRVLSFHSRVTEAEAMAVSVPAVAARLAEDDPDTYPPADQVWSDWLYGEHAPGHRRQVLDEFASDFLGGVEYKGRNVRAELRVLSSVRVLGEGVDTAECDAVLFSDARGSMVDIVQMVGRALRLNPNHGKLATLVVPVFLGPGEDPNELLTSDAYTALSKILGALRAHDAETIEALADPRLRNSRPAADDDRGEDELADGEDEGDVDRAAARVSERAAGVLRFSEERDPAALTRFVQLRVIDPEGAYWLRGIEAATRWLRETGSTELRVPYTYVTPEEWVSAGSHPLGVWTADQRRYYVAGTLEASRVRALEKLGMVWSVHASAWDAGLEVARSYAAVHGHFLPPTGAVWGSRGANGTGGGAGSMPIGVWAKNQRAAARKAAENAVRRAAGETHISYAGELSEARQEALAEIDPGWCPAWDVSWQRAYRLALTHTKAGGAFPTGTGELVVQGEDLGTWITAQRAGWNDLMPAQQYLLKTLGIEPPEEGEIVVPVRRSQDERWNANIAAAQQFHAREGHLRPARKHIEVVDSEPVKLGAFLDNSRRRAAKLSPERRATLDELGMRW